MIYGHKKTAYSRSRLKKVRERAQMKRFKLPVVTTHKSFAAEGYWEVRTKNGDVVWEGEANNAFEAKANAFAALIPA